MGNFVQDNPLTFGLLVVFLIFFAIWITQTLTSVPRSVPTKVQTEVQKYNKCEIFPRCYFNNNEIFGVERIQLINKYPDLNLSDKTVINNITIIDTTDLILNDVCIQSIKSEGYVITLYSKPNFTGEKMTLTDKINIECFEKPMRSARIDIMKGIQLKGSNTPTI